MIADFFDHLQTQRCFEVFFLNLQHAKAALWKSVETPETAENSPSSAHLLSSPCSIVFVSFPFSHPLLSSLYLPALSESLSSLLLCSNF